ncbi:MAG TPA: LLM class flavin-dependent oxidoreductase [Burkholderiales bacterium]|nr:LLM class flavin-dependent oxidoreductase [Burkholderiales bacterium]
MNLGFFTMPMHPIGKDWRLSLAQDREAFVLADQLGFVEGYVGEHATDPEENITSSAMFIATLVDATRRIKLGTGTVNMPNHHPAATAGNLAMLDHLLGGRFIFGISPGALPSDAEVFGSLDKDRPGMFLEAINQVLAIWTGEAPYDLKGDHWTISTARTYIPETGMGTVPRPLQRPHPPIVVTAVAPFSKGITEAAARGWDPISANFLMPVWVKTHWGKYVEGCTRVNRKPDPANWRVAKTVCVAADDTTARNYATDPNGPYTYYYRSLMKKLKRRGALGIFKTDPKMADDDVTLEAVCEKLIIHGSPRKVADGIMAFREEIGDFGTMLYAGMDWQNPALGRNSMILTAEKVLPLVNDAIAGEKAAAPGAQRTT